ncbi:DUF1918 domain-containing protein [Mycolicibacterium cosmeticum]|uniref:DUF1918 domain-containing protein n=1 Tax=Mycolicibacterium cosmeticum TaxID=258533 RepID=W9B7P3_MYCCO|nr:DUF1918 domain-containing protein [Mycolicibacterium cosmeticum]TLH74069.1 DUF1918 domain-containing protein [Mycolicibacterium cosmeticum]CDO11002.1 hypothetical protein BN977_05843 [Mycolicibacterium cosmeticum]
MRAKVGDWLIVKGPTVGQPERRGVITDVRSGDGVPPYIVRWLDSDAETMVFPGPDAVVETADE